MKFSSFNNYILRVPYLSYNEVSNLDVNKVIDLCKTKDVSEAIYLASPDLYNEMKKLLENGKVENEDKLIHSLLKYLLRMGTRCTPFGLFSGCSLGEIDEYSLISLEERSNYKRVTRLDMNYLCSLSQTLENNQDIRRQLLFYPNNSLYKIGDEIRYVEYKYINTRRKHFLMSIESSEFIIDVLEKSKKGILLEDLANYIVDPEISIHDALEFVNELIDSQILISSISPSLTGKDYFELIRANLYDDSTIRWLETIDNKLKSLDIFNSEDNFNLYKEIAELAQFYGTKVNSKYLFQTDLNIKCLENKLSKEIIEDVKSGIVFLNKISSKKEYNKLEIFKRKFLERFEEEEVPLTYALDVETGIGYGEEFEDASSFSISDLVDDLPISYLGKNDKTTKINKIIQTKLDKILLPKILSSYRNNETIIEFFDEDVKDLAESWDEVPHTFSTIVRILEIDDSKPLIFMSGFGGSTATYLLSRFAHLDKNIYNFIDEVIEKEQEEDAIFAEILHLPESRTGNVLYRNNTREFEIPYLAQSLLPQEQQITISDLMVSVRNGKIILRSKINNKIVYPLLSNAHNIEADPLPIYSFLTELQTQNYREHFGFKWGDILSSELFLPRVIYKNIIFSLAMWKVPKVELDKINSVADLSEWLIRRGIPRKVQISDLDNNLFIDFENELNVQLFLSHIKNKQYIMLKENLFNEEKAMIMKDNQAYTNEIVLSFYKESI
jgi:hypothetical protein